MAGECVVSLTQDQFDAEVLQNPGTTLVDFYTPGCAPCRTVAPILEQLCAENRGKLKVVKVDAWENPDLAASHRVSAVPTLVLFHGGKNMGHIVGSQSKAQLEKWIASSVAGTS